MRIRFGMVLVVLLMLLSACSNQHLVGNGKKAQDKRTVASFSRLQVVGHIVVKFVQSKRQSVVVTADSNILPIVVTTVTNGRLLLSMKPGVRFSTKNPIVVDVTAPTLVDVSSSGDNIIHISGLDSAGLTVGFNGSGEATFSGKVKQVNYNIIGTSRLNAENLQSQNVSISVVGAGEIEVKVSDFLNVHVSGVGHVTYYGNPKLEQKVYGLGKLIKGKL